MDPVGEALPDLPWRGREGDDSSVEDLFDEVWEDEDDGLDAYGPGEEEIAGAGDFAGVGQGDAGAPAVYELVVGGLSALVAVAAEPDVGVGDSVSSDMEDLF